MKKIGVWDILNKKKNITKLHKYNVMVDIFGKISFNIFIKIFTVHGMSLYIAFLIK